MTGFDFGATITIPIIAVATGTINIFWDQIHNCMWKPIQVQVELTPSEMCATITIFVHSTPEYTPEQCQ
jgi:hypothetical protein